MYKPKIFFTASYAGKKRYQKYYDLVVKAIRKNDVDLVGTEVGNYKQLLTLEEQGRIQDPAAEHYLAIKKGIMWADLVILELSHECFQVGHEATLAVLANKPVLGLSLHEDWSKRIVHKHFHGAKYNQYFVDTIVREFIEKYAHEKLTERLNLFLSPTQLERLKQKAQAEEMNISEYIRSLI